MKPMLKAPGTERLTLKYIGPLSFFAFKFNLRGYTMDDKSAAASEALRMKELVSANDISKEDSASAGADADGDAPVGRRRISLDQTNSFSQTTETMPDITGRAESLSLDLGLLNSVSG
jgi:hypothetical protein